MEVKFPLSIPMAGTTPMTEDPTGFSCLWGTKFL